jgi:hypothetical protein
MLLKKLVLALICGLPIWPMIRNPFFALVQEGGFGIWEKKDLPHLSNFESVPNFDKERQYKYFKVNAGDIPKDLEENPGKIIRHPIVWLCNWSVRGDTMPESSYTPKKELSLSGIGPLAYNLLHTLYPILSDAKEDKKWLKPIKARNNWSSF